MTKRFEMMKRTLDALLARKDRVLVAIDGSCAAGKTTLAAELARVYDCNLFHMDDFFLRPEQRTAQRFAEPGGNVDYERFRAEILAPLQAGGEFSYRPFDCATFTLGRSVAVSEKWLNIIEGSYSHHPYFGDPYDLRVFLTVEAAERHRRILERPAFLHQRFFEEWIPMEERYFTTYRIQEKSDLVLD